MDFKSVCKNIPVLHHKLQCQDCKVVFYGASVTQQSKGYATILRNLMSLDIRLKHILTFQMGFGSLHIKEAALLLDQTVLVLHTKNTLHICVLEWFTSTWDIDYNDLVYVVNMLLKNNILPVFLLLYNHSDRDQRAKTKELYYKIASKYTLPLIDIDSMIESNKLYITKLFRDNTHLTDEGGEFLGKMVFDNMMEEYKTIPCIISKIVFIPFDKKFLRSSNRTLEVKSSGNPDITSVAYGLDIEDIVQIPNIPDGEIVAIWTIAGPDSGIISITSSSSVSQKMCIWDEWSHYHRFTIRRFSGKWLTIDNLILHLTSDIPDKSKCRREVSEWPVTKFWLLGWSIKL